MRTKEFRKVIWTENFYSAKNTFKEVQSILK